MTKTIVVCGHGPGISEAVARRFGAEGFGVALIARNRERVEEAAAALAEAKIPARGFAADLRDPSATKAAIEAARAALGPIGVVHYNAYGGGAGDLLSAPPEELRTPYEVAVVGLVAAVQAALPDLEAAKGSLLVTGGGLSAYDAQVDAMAVDWRAMGLAVGKAAQHKTVGLLSAALKKRGVYVGEVVVMGAVKGTAFDRGRATLDAGDIAARFFSLHEKRDATSVRFPG
jgi:NAD(P)-dependent dehydrogenase (short-subunit alcohol dehydrogenase family)